jgi:hypothetical protein
VEAAIKNLHLMKLYQRSYDGLWTWVRTWIERNGDREIGRQINIKLGFMIGGTRQFKIDSAIRR